MYKNIIYLQLGIQTFIMDTGKANYILSIIGLTVIGFMFNPTMMLSIIIVGLLLPFISLFSKSGDEYREYILNNDLNNFIDEDYIYYGIIKILTLFDLVLLVNNLFNF